MAKMTPSQRDKTAVFTVAILGLTIIGIAIVLILGRPRPTRVAVNPPRPTRTPEPTRTPSPLTVYVSGAVVRPNRNYTLPPGSRVDAALEAAGGPLPSADLSRVNLADILRDGAQIHVPGLSQAPASPSATPIGGVTINVNTATIAELETLPGIGPALAQRIIDYRTQQGLFTSVEDLDNVSGIGPSLIEQLRDLVRFE